MKLSTLLLIAIAVQFTTIIFDTGSTYETPILGFLRNPTDWSNSLLILVFGSIAVGLALAGSFVGSLFFGKQDLMVFAPLITAIISWTVPLVSLWQIIYGESGLFGDAGWIIASMLTAPFYIIGLFTIINWWRSTTEG